MPTSYNGQKLIPLATATVTKEYQRSESDEKIGQLYNITLNGTLVAYKGSPTSSGTFWVTTGYPPDETIVQNSRLKSIINKQEAIRCLFSTDGALLEIQPFDGSAPLKCNPRVRSIEFEPGPWTELCNYTVNLEADSIFNNLSANCPPDFPQKVSDASEEWQLESDNADLQTYRLSHNLSAKGKRSFDVNGVVLREPWEEARLWVHARLGLDTNRIVASGLLNLPSYYGGFNYIRGETVNKLGGNYSVSETWLVASGTAIEEFTVENRLGEDGRNVVSINGTVTGLETRNNTSWSGFIQAKYDAAQSKFINQVQPALLNRAQTYSGITLNPLATNVTVGRNPIGGVITYGTEFNDRPSNLIAGSKSETFTIQDTNQHDIFAVIPVIGRSVGPVLQSMGARSEKRRRISLEVVAAPGNYLSGLTSLAGIQSQMTALIGSYAPGGSFGPSVAFVNFLSSDEQTVDVFGSRISRNVEYVYE